MYGIDEKSDPTTVDTKFTQYVIYHNLNLHKWSGILNNEWKNYMYYKGGYDFARYVHNVLAFPVE
jgi:hypothetical protein